MEIKDVLREMRDPLVEISPRKWATAIEAAMEEPRAWIWRREYTNGGYEERLCAGRGAAEELAEDSYGLPKRDLIIPLYALPPDQSAEIERLKYLLSHWYECWNDGIPNPDGDVLDETVAALAGKEESNDD